MSEITFADLGLGAKVEAAIEATGYTTPTPIQAAAIPIALTGQDVLGIAQTGTGKTASFTLPMISRLERGRARARMPRSLILAPTRELAAQVAEAFEKYGVNHKLSVALLIGGVSFDEQNRKLDRGADVLIATPGRMIDHFQRGRLLLTGVEILVIDEADRMLDMGFIPDIERICKLLPPKRQTLFFSATMPTEIQRLVDTFLRDPARVEVAKPATAAKTITQRFIFCRDGEDWAKRDMLREQMRASGMNNAIVFCNRKRDVAILNKSLNKHGFNAGCLHGDMDQTSRMETLAAFRNGEIAILAASDVAARGLDIPDVSYVFNFDVPWAADDYVHRIGRTGRAGREGCATTIVGPDDLKLISAIETITGEAPVWIGEPPTEEDYAEAGKKKGRGRGRGARTASKPGSSASSRSVPSASSSSTPSEPRARRSGRRSRGDTARTVDGTAEVQVESQVEHRAEPQVKARAPEADLPPGMGEQPDIMPAVVAPADGPPPETDTKSERPRRGRSRRTPKSAESVEAASADAMPETNADAAFAGHIPDFLKRPVRRLPKATEPAT